MLYKPVVRYRTIRRLRAESSVPACRQTGLTPGGLSCAPPVGGAEGRAIDPERMGAAVALQAMAGHGSQSRFLRDGRWA